MKHSFVYGLWNTFDVIITSPAHGISCLGFTKIQPYRKNTRIDPEKNTAIFPFPFNSRVTLTSILSMCVSYNLGRRPVGRNSCKPYNVSYSVPSNIHSNDACNLLRCTLLSYISEHAISFFPSQWLKQIKSTCFLPPEFYSRIHRFFSEFKRTQNMLYPKTSVFLTFVSKKPAVIYLRIRWRKVMFNVPIGVECATDLSIPLN